MLIEDSGRKAVSFPIWKEEDKAEIRWSQGSPWHNRLALQKCPPRQESRCVSIHYVRPNNFAYEYMWLLFLCSLAQANEIPTIANLKIYSGTI